MSNSQLEDAQEAKLVAWLSSETGFSTDELNGHTLDEIDGNDGALYGYVVTLCDGRSERVGIPPDRPVHDD